MNSEPMTDKEKRAGLQTAIKGAITKTAEQSKAKKAAPGKKKAPPKGLPVKKSEKTNGPQTTGSQPLPPGPATPNPANGPAGVNPDNEEAEAALMQSVGGRNGWMVRPS